MPPCISVIVPVYKVEPYLNKCIDSILGQTYQNLEIILVDDGSPDNCGKICDEYAASDSRIKVIHKVNGGLSDARNAGLDICTGEYITFVDSDDWIDCDHIHSLYSLLCTEDQNTIAVSNAKRIDTTETLVTVFSWQPGKTDEIQSVFGYAWNKLYPSQLLRDKRFPPVSYIEDLPFNFSLLSSMPRFVYSHKDSYNYLLRPDSILTVSISERKIRGLIQFSTFFWDQLCDLYGDNVKKLEIFTHYTGNQLCNTMCELALNDSLSPQEKFRLARILYANQHTAHISWKFANHRLLKLLIISKKLDSPWIYLFAYKLIYYLRKRRSA